MTGPRTPGPSQSILRPNAGMGVKRRLVDQGLWFNAGGTVLQARFLGNKALFICEVPGNSWIWMLVCRARCQEFEPSNHLEELAAPRQGADAP